MLQEYYSITYIFSSGTVCVWKLFTWTAIKAVSLESRAA